MDIAKIAAPSHSGRLMVPPVCPGCRRMITFCCWTSASVRTLLLPAGIPTEGTQ
ncbi:hypothetical protein DV515_00002881 [Chloebia gouldiae]|uniref:Uncharacterized protein n=1 Tax=Chloebia gouldiae TaxID=44316 RepID=A0A3L8SVH9_CHLGU|nr:hypothetical protein DV515_00002881 [Chloebia gouldiae]